MLAGLLGAGAAAAADAPGAFSFSPVPRWQTEPELEVVCAAVRRECPDLAGLPEIATTVAFDELYNASGHLAGLRMTRGTGCAPIDESILVGQRTFRTGFHRPDQPDLEGTRLELRPGIDPEAVRIVKSVEMQYSAGGCAG